MAVSDPHHSLVLCILIGLVRGRHQQPTLATTFILIIYQPIQIFVSMALMLPFGAIMKIMKPDSFNGTLYNIFTLYLVNT